MKLLVVLVSLFLVVFGRDIRTDENDRSKRQELTRSEEMLKSMQILNHQLMMTQLAMEERVRSEGGSGLKQVRVNNGGTRPYHIPHFGGNQFAAIHDHANNKRTVGMGELSAVMNGVEFTTRHIDYRLVQPSTSSAGYHDVQDIEFPDVPPEVLAKGTVPEQIAEMKLWFKAFAEQDFTVRDYRRYFKPVLSYLEASWTFSNETVEDECKSDTHQINANTWTELEDKVRFTSATGRKDLPENFAHLPSKFVDIGNGAETLKAKWNYRILCHPLRRDIPLGKLRPVDDVASRFGEYWNYDLYQQSRDARFQMTNYPPTSEAIELGSDMDEIMGEIPGPDNYQGNIEDKAMDQVAYKLDPSQFVPINGAYYNRYYKDTQKGALGLTSRHRGFSDPNLFVALTTHDKVPPVTFTSCKGPKKNQVCITDSQRPVYAVPIEIIYLTPLTRWNPYDLKYKGDASSTEGMTVEATNANGISRNGGLTPDLAYDGTNSNRYYVTPAEFFDSGEFGVDPADTTKDVVGVLDQKGEVKSVRASGIRVHLPEIEGAGVVRQRYPIMPVYAEGSTTWKQTAALEDALMQMQNYLHLYKYMPPIEDRLSETNENTTYTVYMGLSIASGIEPHYHQFTVTQADLDYIAFGKKKIYLTSSLAAGHTHKIEFGYHRTRQEYIFTKCDGTWACPDKHPKWKTRMVKNPPITK